MLRPERMSRVSVTGSKQVMEPVVEAMHDLRLVDLTDYDGAWEGFEPGDTVEGGNEASEKLVTVRSLKSILGVAETDAGPTRLVTEEALDEELGEIREEVNELDDRRDGLKDELRTVEENIDSVEPFAALGLDLDLLTGYDSLAVGVGEGDADAIEAELADSDRVADFEVFSEGDAVAVFVYPEDGDPTTGTDVTVQDLLVGARYQSYEVPDAEGSPEEYISELHHRKQQLESKLGTVEDELGDLRLDVAGFLLAAEETLAIEAQKSEAPLSFATTENAFVAEGWLPTEQYEELVAALDSTVGDRVEVEELERAEYDTDGHVHHTEDVAEEGGATEGETGGVGSPVSTDSPDSAASAAESEEAEQEQEKEPVADGGNVTMGDEDPPVVQDNPGPAKPFEALVGVINRPKYSEFDPTVLLFLTFPAFFGFMIGDLGYGILYIVLGYWLYSSFDSDMLRSLGGVGIWAGAFTAIFGILYGEIFGFHYIAEYLWGGSAPIHKGLQPYHSTWAQAWLVISLLAGMVHLAIGWVLDFVHNFQSHGFGDAMGESGSWLLMLFGIWAWIFGGAFGSAPGLLYGSDSVFNGHPLPLGFAGLPEPFGLVGLGAFFVGLVLLVNAEPVEGVEFLNVLVNVLSYTRIAAVLLAKAAMAFVVNLLVFGVYVTEEHGGEAWHFGTGGMPEAGTTYHGYEVVEIMFGGLVHSGVAGILVGILILVIGHLLVLALGVTSAGLQGVRLEYVEFFGKFYEGGGRKYTPFGYEREYTAED
ncbi:V-type ATP synthase subunit I [Halorientalis halophila]|uniref:V-type ATP synthase subunit I n=1 Tax=Halorientalis halophila TaxID=3108499 RepID=UPI00300AAC51